MLFPLICPYCGKLTDQDSESCSKCKPLIAVPIHTKILKNGVICASAFHYTGIYRQALINYKYNGYGQFTRPFSLTFRRVINTAFPDIEYDFAAEVPQRIPHTTHTKRLARYSAKEINIAYAPLLYKTKSDEYQHFKTAKERRKISRSLYKYNQNIDITGKNIILFDDIITTGSTLYVCSSALLDAGAKSVDCVTLMW